MGDGRGAAAAAARHAHHEEVVLPDGSAIWACSFPTNGYDRLQPPAFGLYLDPQWRPLWEHAHIDWPDFGLPRNTEELTETLADLLNRAQRGEMVEVGCLGGHGRTGTAVACLAVLAGLQEDPVDWIRAIYCPQAIETDDQQHFVRQLHDEIRTTREQL